MSFASDLIKSFGGNPTNIPMLTFVNQWMTAEGGGTGQGPHGWNPLNVAGDPGFPTWTSSDGAQINIYPNEATAVARTHARIASGYPNIAKAFSDTSVDASHIRALLPELCKWGSKNFAGQLAGSPDYCTSGKIGSGGQATEGAGAADWTSFDLSSVWSSFTGWLDVLEKFAAFVIWLLQPKHWVQMLEVLAAIVLVILGLKHLADTFSQDNPVRRAASKASKVPAVASLARRVP